MVCLLRSPAPSSRFSKDGEFYYPPLDKCVSCGSGECVDVPAMEAGKTQICQKVSWQDDDGNVYSLCGE